MNRQIFRGAFWGVLLCILSAVSAVASTQVIDDVEMLTVDAGVEVRIRFNFPLRYLGHAPKKRGKLLQIELRSLFAGMDLPELSGRKVYSWKPTAARPLSSLTYEGDNPGGPQLLLEFEQEVEYRLMGGSDPLRLTFLLLKPESPVIVGSQGSISSPPRTEPSAVKPLADSREPDLLHPYAINLASELKSIEARLPDGSPDLQGYLLYTTRFQQGEKNWHRLRLGFFADKQSAQQVMRSLKKKFPDAWLTRTTLEERRTALNILRSEPLEVAAAVAVPVPVRGSQPVMSAARTQSLLDQAEASMVAADYPRAALFYTRLLQAEDLKTRQLAQEYLGLARDRANQQAHAKAEYEKYLQLYPEGEGAARVQQRLTALLTARSLPRKPLRRAKQQLSAEAWQHEVYGSFSQFYYHDSLTTDNKETLLAQSTLRSDIDINTRSRKDNLDFSTTFIGGLENDFREDADDELRISSLYFDLAARDPDLSIRFGRQSRSTGGVLGRFDGGLFRWQLNEKIAANLIGGFPVYSTSETSVDTDRPVYGLSFDLGTFAKRWDINLFFINQQVDSLTDRRAVGGELRYFDSRSSFFTLVDYDVFYHKLNTILFNGNLRFANQSTLTLSADYRNSPMLATSNALQGQSAVSISELQKTYTDDEIQQLALDRTATSQSYTLGYTYPLNQKLQINGDVSMARFGSTPASGGVEALDGGANSYYYSLQLIGSSLIKQGDIAIIGLRYSDTDSSNSLALNLNTRYPLTRALRLNPKMLLEYRNSSNSAHRWRIRPALRMEYRWKKRYHLDMEGGAEWAEETTAGQKFRNRDIFFTLGYRVDF